MNASDDIRSFLGIPLVGVAKDAVIRVQDRARERLHDDRQVKWERPANLHATLQFLGDTPRSALDEIAHALARAVRCHDPFELGLSKPAIFGGNKPRVFVVETSEGSDALRALQADLARELSELGFEPESRPFSPHFTVGRVRRGRKVKPIHRAEAEKLFDGGEELTVGASLDVSEVVHFESQLSPTGATYSRLATFTLGSNPT